MPLKIGNGSISAIKVGATDIAKIYRGSELVYQKSRLPDEYHELEYIESTGTQRIDTGLTVLVGARWYSELDLQYTEATSASQVAIATASSNGSWFGQNGSMYSIGGSDGQFEASTNRVVAYGTWGNAPETTINGVRRFYLDTINTQGGKVYLFANNDNAPFFSKMKLYGAKIYNADHKLIRDFIPAERMSDGMTGLYDIVNDVFYMDEKGGDFLARRIVPKTYTASEYLQSSGTQYIDTGVIANQDTKLTMDMEFLNEINEESPFGAYESSSKFVWNFSFKTYSYPMFGSVADTIEHSLVVNRRYALEMGQNGAYLNGNQVKTYPAQTFQMTGSINLFRRNPISGTTNPRMSIIKMYDCNIYQADKLIHEYLPAVRNSDSVAGLYDALTNTFLTNVGTGDFETTVSIANGKSVEIDADSKALSGWQVKGDTEQASPSGENLYNPVTASRNTYIGWNTGIIATQNNVFTSDFIEVKPNVSYEVKNRTDWVTQTFWDDKKAFIGGSDKVNIFSVPSNAKYVRITGNMRVMNNISFDIAPPNPEFPQEVKTVTGRNTVSVSGKNLFNLAKIAPDMVNSFYPTTATGRITYTDNSIVLSSDISFSPNFGAGSEKQNEDFYTTLEKNTDYTFSFTGTNVTIIGYAYDQSTNRHVKLIRDTDKTVSTFNSGNYDNLIVRFGKKTSGTPSEYSNIQLEKSSTATAYEPYSSNDYEINLGKNLFDKDNVVPGIPGPNTGEIIRPTETGRTTQFIRVNAGDVYTCSGQGSYGWTTTAYYDKNKSFISRPATGDGTHTVPAGAYYMRKTCAEGALDTIQLERGDKATSYAPYFEPIELCKIGDYQDRIFKDGDTWKIHKAISKYTFETASGTGANWEGATHRVYFTNNYQNAHGITFAEHTDTTTQAPLLADKFKAISFDDLYVNGESGIALSSSKTLSIRNNSWTDETTARNEIIGTTMYYALATPTTTTITYQPLIDQLNELEKLKAKIGYNLVETSGSVLAPYIEFKYKKQ